MRRVAKDEECETALGGECDRSSLIGLISCFVNVGAQQSANGLQQRRGGSLDRVGNGHDPYIAYMVLCLPEHVELRLAVQVGVGMFESARRCHSSAPALRVECARRLLPNQRHALAHIIRLWGEWERRVAIHEEHTPLLRRLEGKPTVGRRIEQREEGHIVGHDARIWVVE